jgi:hypothetical protein
VIRLHRLQFFFRVNTGRPPTFVDRFDTGGRRSFEADFAPRARRYRNSNRIVIVLLICFALGTVAAGMFPAPEGALVWIVLPFAALLPLAVLIHFINRWIRCPSCRRSLTPAKGRYCPQCGAEGYVPGSRRCEACGGRIEEETAEDARGYLIRGCTHCGVFLDKRGL